MKVTVGMRNHNERLVNSTLGKEFKDYDPYYKIYHFVSKRDFYG
jgi:hypothetical protein